MAIDTADASADTVRHARATVRPEKAAAVAALAAAFRGSSAAVLTEYRGLTVAQISELRVALGADTTYSVVKNTLTKIAAADAGVEGVEDLLEGPTAVAFIAGEPVQAAKALRDFAKAHPVLVVKGGVMDGRTITAQEISKLADLESREVLLAKMAGALLASLTNAACLFNAPLAQAARVLGALQAKAEEDPSVLQAADPVAPEAPEAPAPEAAAPEADADGAADPEADAEAAAPAADSPALETADSPTEGADAAANDGPTTA